MNKDTAGQIVKGLSQGMADILIAMLGQEINQDTAPPEVLEETQLSGLLRSYSVLLGGALPASEGAAALLLREAEALQLAAILLDDQSLLYLDAFPKESLHAMDGVSESLIGGGMMQLQEQFGHQNTSLDHTLTLREASKDLNKVIQLLGESPWHCRITIQAKPALALEGVLLFSDSLGRLAPPESAPNLQTHASKQRATSTADETPQDPAATLSTDEINDILRNTEDEAMEEDWRPAQDNLEMVLDLRLKATARLGHVTMPLQEILQLGPGSELDIAHQADEPVDLLVNGKVIARGEVVVVEDKFALRITEVLSPQERIERLR